MYAEVKVFIAEDHPIFRYGLRQMIERTSSIEVVGEAEDGETAWKELLLSGADVALLDVDLPGKDGFEIARGLRAAGLPIVVVFLTMHKDELFLKTALELGAKGYLVKDSAMKDIVQCIRAVASGQEFISPQLTSFLLDRGRRAARPTAEPQLALLTDEERRVLRLLAEYKSSSQIAEELGLSVHAVEQHRGHIGQKLELVGHHALLKFALAHKAEL